MNLPTFEMVSFAPNTMKAKSFLLGKVHPYPWTWNPSVLNSPELYSFNCPNVYTISLPLLKYSQRNHIWVFPVFKKKKSSHMPLQLLLHFSVPFITESLYIHSLHFLISDSFLKPWQLGFHSTFPWKQSPLWPLNTLSWFSSHLTSSISPAPLWQPLFFYKTSGIGVGILFLYSQWSH